MDNSQKLQNLPDLLPNSKQEFIINQRQPSYNEFEAQKLVDEDDEASEVDDSKDDDSIRRRNRRRSKNDNDGRSYRCQNCGKAYLSYPALYTHIKTKHDLQSTGSTKGRGRPKKDIGVTINSLKLLYNPSTFEFYKHPERTGETFNIYECMEAVYNEIYIKLRTQSTENTKKISYIPSIDYHPLFIKIQEIFQNPRTPEENAKCDEVFAFYIFKISKLAKPEFFLKVLKFVILFRECVNMMYRSKVKINEKDETTYEYTETFNPEDAPDISNEFVTEFLVDSSGFDVPRDEAVDLTQNFCQWMYDNNYTCSKLSLISNY